MQTRQLEHQIREAQERADFKRWWIKQQKQQLRERERAVQAPPTLIRQSPAAALPTLARQSPAASSPSLSREKGKSIPGKSLAKNSPGIFQDCQSDISMGEEGTAAHLDPEAAVPEVLDTLPPPVEPSSSSTFQRFLRTVTRSQQNVSQVDGNLSDDELSEMSYRDDPSYKPPDDVSSTESDFSHTDFTEDELTEHSQKSLKSKMRREQGPLLYKHFLTSSS